MAIVPPLPVVSSLATRGVDLVVRGPAASTSELPARSAQSGPAADPARAASASAEAGAVLAPDLSRLLATIDLLDGGSRAEVEWPGPVVRHPGGALAQTPGEALAVLHDALARSPLFAIRRLTERWFPATVALLDAHQRGDDASGAATDAATDAAVGRSAHARMPTTDDAGPAVAPERAVPIADRPVPRDLAQAAALMIGGRLHWQGELTPGVPASSLGAPQTSTVVV